MTKTLEQILPLVQKPARYTGGEYNAVVKDRSRITTRFALCFPDTYEIGMSNLGLRILYGILNEQPDIWCERAFAPWGDMEEQMRARGIPLYGLESGDALRDFDILGFSVGYEMAYSNILNMLDLAGIPVRAAEREEAMPLIIMGGTCAYNPEPLAPFIDLFVLGEGEEVLLELTRLYQKSKREGHRREEFLRAAAAIGGIYVPRLYDVTHHPDGTVAAIAPQDGAPMPVVKRIVEDFDRSYFPVRTIVPSTEVVHDRVMLELFRGCVRGCRFCQAGYAYRPVRSRGRETLRAQGIAACEDSGYQEMTLSSLSTSDYRELTGLCDDLAAWCRENQVSLSLPSLRADNFSMALMQRLSEGRKSGLTFAPEAGTQRLRDAINKNVTEEDLLTSCRTAFSGGWSSLKLYFMLGLPTETDADVLGIADLVAKVCAVWRESASNRARGLRVTVSTACFVPKAHTAFQWEGQVTMEEYRRRVDMLRERLRPMKQVSYNWHDAQTSFLEAVFSRGDRRLGVVLEAAWRAGARFDAWSEYFNFDRWMAAFEACGVDPRFYATRVRDLGETLPWAMTSVGVTADFFRRERDACYRAEITPDCRRGCAACGANSLCPGGVCDG